MIEVQWDDPRLWNTVGLLLDIVGVYVLTSAVLISKKTATELAATMYNGNEQLRDALLKQSRRGWWGMAFMIPGFALQIFGTWI